MLTYEESSWAARRWDWFNGGRIVQPLSFCHFWRIILVWASLKWLLSPIRWLSSLIVRIDETVSSRLPRPDISVPNIPWHHTLLPVKLCWFLLRWGARIFWFLLHPVRWGSKPVGRVALAGIVNAGEHIGGFGERHKEGLKSWGAAFLVVFLAAEVIFILGIFLWVSWFWTLIAIGAIPTVGFAVYGFFKSEVPNLLWEAAVATHHGICPPVTIVRSSKAEGIQP